MNLLPLFLMTFFLAVCTATIKILSDKVPRTVALFVQYFFCAVYMVAFWILFDRTMLSAKEFFVIALGVSSVNYIGAYCQWAAYKNMARTSLFSPLSGVLTIVLFWIFLKEYQYLSNWALVGVGLHLVAIWMFLSAKKEVQTAKSGSIKSWLFFMAGMVIFTGILHFMMKVLSKDVPETHFLLCWYCGTFGFSAFFFFANRKANVNYLLRREKVFWLLPVCSLGIVGYLAAQYWAFQTNSGTLVASYSALNSTFVPVITGWAFFKEAKAISRREIAGLACGVVAAVLIIASH